MKEVFVCYKSEGAKLIEILNQKKDKGYIITCLKFDGGLVTASFEKYDKDFVYSLDYSKRYYDGIDNDDEYFDIARLNGWKLQFVTDGMGIWINEDVEKAIPFFLEEEYLRIENEDYRKRMRSIKRTAIFNTSLLILGVFHFIWRGGVNVFYGLPFLAIYYYLFYGIINNKNKYPELSVEFISACFTSSLYILPKIKFNYAVIIEVIYIIICFCLLKEDSLIIKKRLLPLFLYFWIILFVLCVIFGG
ncbi:hypothetical protein [Thomasclavelia sp.]